MTMKRLMSLLALFTCVTFAAAGCSEDNTTGAPPSGTTDPDPTFSATLSPANEVPPVTNAEAGASGTMNVTINATRDSAGAIIAATVSFNGTLSGFPAGTAITAAHIHTGSAGATGGPVVNLGLSAGEITLTTGGGTIVKNTIAVSLDIANQIIANPAAFYFNAHTAANPGGAVRGQLVRTN